MLTRGYMMKFASPTNLLLAAVVLIGLAYYTTFPKSPLSFDSFSTTSRFVSRKGSAASTLRPPTLQRSSSMQAPTEEKAHSVDEDVAEHVAKIR